MPVNGKINYGGLKLLVLKNEKQVRKTFSKRHIIL